MLGPARDPPDVSALASLDMASINHSTVHDLCVANKAVEGLKAEPLLGIRPPHIPTHKVRWATIQDTSSTNAAADHSQVAFLVGATSLDLWDNASFPFALLSHKSHSLIWKCPSTWPKPRSCWRYSQRPTGSDEPSLQHRRIGGQIPESRSHGGSTSIGRRNEASEGLADWRRQEPVKSFAHKHRVVPTTGTRPFTNKTSDPAWKHRMLWRGGWTGYALFRPIPLLGNSLWVNSLLANSSFGQFLS